MMAIYVDEIREYPSGKWCHLWTDETDLEKLHTLARRIGMKRRWFQPRPGFYHYDLTPGKRTQALKAGAVFLPLRDWVMRQYAATERAADAD